MPRGSGGPCMRPVARKSWSRWALYAVTCATLSPGRQVTMAEPQTPIPAKPPSVHDLDAELAKTAHGLWRSRWRALLIFAVLAAAGVLVLAAVALRQAAINQQQADRLHASCQFYLDIAQAPITLPPGATRPSLLGVKIVADSWVAYHHQGCGASPPPTPSLRHWATYYHLRLT